MAHADRLDPRLRARRRACAAAARRSPMPNWRRWSTPPTSGSCSAPASASATSPATARRRRRWRPRRREAALAAAASSRPTSISSSSRPRRPTTLFPRSRPRCRRSSASSTASLSICRRSAPASSSPSRRPTSSCVSGSHKRALVIGAETFSRILDWTDRTTCVLFGDGAGAIVLEARDSDGRLASPGVIASHLRSDGRHRAKLYVDGGPSTTKTVGHLAHGGQGGVPPRGRHGDGRHPGLLRRRRRDRGRDRLVRAASGQPPDHRRLRRQARHRARQGDRHRRPARQHLRRLDPARARRRRSRTAASSPATW